ncbi:MAG: hypothetical protein HYT12_00195 [Candidatus Liptonbacteria bacterium]|nr:hypothetical protein [Candidatus Liptonbacteria bacterium]
MPFRLRMKFIFGFAAMGLLAGLSDGFVGAAAGALTMGSVAAIGTWLMS